MGLNSPSDIHRKSRLPSASEEELEQALAIVWNQLETGRNSRVDLEKILETELHAGMFENLLKQNLLQVNDGTIDLSAEGRKRASPVVRRHRLAERLLQDVLTVPEDEIDPVACRLEHVISSGVEDAICTLLGHPKVCPHGGLIPSGACCGQALGEAKPIVFPLSSQKAGSLVHVVYLSPLNRPELHKFIALGVVPGATLRLVQTFPTFAVEVGGTLLAMEAELAKNIFVRRCGT
jgi:DtxR family transcriptional regulator, Mn-dependent transcriptional regulator